MRHPRFSEPLHLAVISAVVLAALLGVSKAAAQTGLRFNGSSNSSA